MIYQKADHLITIFYHFDEFYKDFAPIYQQHLLQSGKIQRVRPTQMSISEIATILMMYHSSDSKHFKAYYHDYVLSSWSKDFPTACSYSRFVELIPRAILPLIAFLHTKRMGACSGVSFIDSTKLCVCQPARAHYHRVFKKIATWGKDSVGWFFGLKLHLVVNDQGELLSFVLTPANTADRNKEVMEKLTRKVFGKIFADRGYVSLDLFEELFTKGITLIYRVKKNMKERLVLLADKILLRKRSIIESINDVLKNQCNIEHSRHRSPVNFLAHLFAGLAAYTFLPNKPALKFYKNTHLVASS